MSRGNRAQRKGRATKPRDRFSHVRTAVVLFVCGFVLASGAAAYGYWGVSASGSAESQVVSLVSPGTGTVGAPTSSSLTLSWGVSTNLPPGGGYVVLRSATSGGTYAAVASGTCSGTLTTAGCTDSGLNPNTAYFYEVKAVFGANWVSPPNAFFSGTTVAATGSEATWSSPRSQEVARVGRHGRTSRSSGSRTPAVTSSRATTTPSCSWPSVLRTRRHCSPAQ